MCACEESGRCRRCREADRRRVLDELVPNEPTQAEERDAFRVQTGTDAQQIQGLR